MKLRPGQFWGKNGDTRSPVKGWVTRELKDADLGMIGLGVCSVCSGWVCPGEEGKHWDWVVGLIDADDPRIATIDDRSSEAKGRNRVSATGRMAFDLRRERCTASCRVVGYVCISIAYLCRADRQDKHQVPAAAAI